MLFAAPFALALAARSDVRRGLGAFFGSAFGWSGLAKSDQNQPKPRVFPSKCFGQTFWIFQSLLTHSFRQSVWKLGLGLTAPGTKFEPKRFHCPWPKLGQTNDVGLYKCNVLDPDSVEACRYNSLSFSSCLEITDIAYRLYHWRGGVGRNADDVRITLHGM